MTVSMIRSMCSMVAMLVALLLMGPAIGQQAGAVDAAAQQGADAPLPSAVDPKSYIVGPGDVVQIFVWRNPELSVQLPVRPDGKISTPLVEDMVAVGKTPTQLARDIEGVLAQFIRSPSVNVIVSNPASAFSQVKVVGQVVKPQGLAYRQGLTVMDAVLAVGGLTSFAAGNRAKIVRQVDGKGQEIRIRLDDLVNKGDMRQNKELQPGDVLVVPQSAF
jgi:polysaccharide export outer membrane protein